MREPIPIKYRIHGYEVKKSPNCMEIRGEIPILHEITESPHIARNANKKSSAKRGKIPHIDKKHPILQQKKRSHFAHIKNQNTPFCVQYGGYCSLVKFREL
jgi:hypothetical protein